MFQLKAATNHPMDIERIDRSLVVLEEGSALDTASRA